jgi:putative endonuclease
MAAPDPARRAAERHGHRAENRAALALRLKGYRILARRFRTPVGEIDIIARRGRTIVFVEVKARATRDAALLAVTPAGRSRIIRAARFWLGRQPGAAGFDLRFDVILVMPRRWPAHMQGAFDEEGG